MKKKKESKKLAKPVKTCKVELDPSASDIVVLHKGEGTARKNYNIVLESLQNLPASFVKELTVFTLINRMREIHRSEPLAYGWVGEVNSMIGECAMEDLHSALHATHGDAKKVKFRSRNKDVQSFRIKKKNPNTFEIESDHWFNLNWTRAYGRLRLKTKESISFLKNKNIKTLTISEVAGRIFVSFTYEETRKPLRSGTGTVGIDLGIKHPAVSYDSNGNVEFFDEHVKSLKNAEKATKRAQRKLSHKQRKTASGEPSSNYKKALTHLQACYLRETNIRGDAIKKFATAIVENNRTIKMDTFGLGGARKLKRCRRALTRVAPSAIKSKIEAKAKERGCNVVIIPSGTPTTQTCSSCGALASPRLRLSDRTYRCPQCGLEINRDLNSAINAYKF